MRKSRTIGIMVAAALVVLAVTSAPASVDVALFGGWHVTIFTAAVRAILLVGAFAIVFAALRTRAVR